MGVISVCVCKYLVVIFRRNPNFFYGNTVTESVFSADAAVSLQYFSSEGKGKRLLTCLQLDVCMCVYAYEYIPGEKISEL